MANGFAGAGQSADRRRRRLSHDLNDNDEFQVDADSNSASGEAASQVWTSEFDTQLLRKVLSPKLWKHVTAITILVLCASAMIYQLNVSTQDTNSPSAQEHTSALQHTSARFASCFLLLAGQLALLIGWIRGESDLDYKGRFRWWTTLAIGILTAAVLRLTDSSTWAADTVIAIVELGTGSLNAARTAVLLVPCVVASAILAYRIVPDMQRCFESQLIMVVSVLALIVAIAWQHIGATQMPSSILASLDLGICVLTFSSLLLHARYVAYVNHDPPELIQKSVTEAIQTEELQIETAESEITSEGLSVDEESVVFQQPQPSTKSEPEVATGPSKQPAVATKKATRTKKRRKTRKAA
ncbi:MAG: hypothetical protein ABJZ55_01540 [Fuerstiella sp.]